MVHTVGGAQMTQQSQCRGGAVGVRSGLEELVGNAFGGGAPVLLLTDLRALGRRMEKSLNAPRANGRRVATVSPLQTTSAGQRDFGLDLQVERAVGLTGLRDDQRVVGQRELAELTVESRDVPGEDAWARPWAAHGREIACLTGLVEMAAKLPATH